MFTRILSATAAEPILELVRARARRTPLARLGVVYQILPEYRCRPAFAAPACCVSQPRPPQNHAAEYAAFLGQSWSHAQLQLTRSLGEGLYLNSIISGGVDGEFLPVSLDRCVAAGQCEHANGAQLDLEA